MGKNVAVGNPFRVIIPQEASANAHQHTPDPWINGLNDKEVIWVAKRNARQTSKKVASKAGKILSNGRYGKVAKSVAASALSQTKPGKSKK